MSSQKTSDPSAGARRKSEWRQILGHYPTGIAVVTSVDAAGQPVGMIVGTFTSVSEEPPLVGFLPQRTSRTFADIRKAGRFRASVLGSEHETLCRQFFSSVTDRFASDQWEYDTHGVPRLKDAVAWFDATIDEVLPAGDHFFVLGAVQDLGLGQPEGAVPLVFLQGGYGTFTTPQTGFNFTDLGGQLRLANSVRETVERLATELDMECVLSTVIRDEVVILAGGDARSSYVGTSFPFAAPMDPGFAAWCSPQLRQAWVENGKRLTGQIDLDLTDSVLRLVRAHGFSISFGLTMTERFGDLIDEAAGDGTAFAGVWETLAHAYADYCTDPRPHLHASVVQLPVFGPDGFVAFELVIRGFQPGISADRFNAVIRAARRCAREITDVLGGTVPSDYLSAHG